jgi:hypothetical protein
MKLILKSGLCEVLTKGKESFGGYLEASEGQRPQLLWAGQEDYGSEPLGLFFSNPIHMVTRHLPKI